MKDTSTKNNIQSSWRTVKCTALCWCIIVGWLTLWALSAGLTVYVETVMVSTCQLGRYRFADISTSSLHDQTNGESRCHLIQSHAENLNVYYETHMDQLPSACFLPIAFNLPHIPFYGASSEGWRGIFSMTSEKSRNAAIMEILYLRARRTLEEMADVVIIESVQMDSITWVPKCLLPPNRVIYYHSNGSDV